MGPREKTYTMRVKERRVQEREFQKALERKIDEMFKNYKPPMFWNYLYWGIYVTVSSLLLYFIAINLPIVLQFIRSIT